MGFISYASHVSYEGDLKLIEWIKDWELIENVRLLESFWWKIFVIRLLIGDEKHINNNGNNGTYFHPYFMFYLQKGMFIKQMPIFINNISNC